MSVEIKDLKTKAALIIELGRSKLNEAETATPERAAELEREFDRMMVDADALEARANRMADLEKREAAINAADPRRTAETREVRGSQSDDREVRAFEAMDNYLRGRELSAEQRSFMRLETRDGQNVGTNSAGGYLVPSKLADAISVSLASGRPMLDSSFVNLIKTTNGEGLNVPALANPNQKGRRVAEQAAANRTSHGFDLKPLTPYKYTSDFIPVSAELMADSAYDIGSFLSEQCGQLVGGIVNEELTKGTGTAMPFGVIPAAGTPAVTTAGSLAITGDDLINLSNSVGIQYHPRASFMFNQNTLGAIRKLKDSNGNYIWTQGLGGLPNQVLGFNYSVNPEVADMAANSVSVAFGDFKKYTVRQVGSPSVRRADELGLGNDEILFILYARYAGNLIDSAAIKTLKIKA